MGFKDHEKISTEDLKLLEPLLVDYFQKPYEESLQLLIRKIEANFLGKDTNSRYKPILINDLGDLTQAVILRLSRINSSSIEERREGVRDLISMTNRISHFVYREWLREARKCLDVSPIDDPDIITPPIPQPVTGEIRSIRNELLLKCLEDCLKLFPTKVKDILKAYYPNSRLAADELMATRRRLASEQAGLTREQADRQTPEQSQRTLNNLQVRVSKWRTGQLDDCIKRCVESKEASHLRLNYLKQQ